MMLYDLLAIVGTCTLAAVVNRIWIRTWYGTAGVILIVQPMVFKFYRTFEPLAYLVTLALGTACVCYGLHQRKKKQEN